MGLDATNKWPGETSREWGHTMQMTSECKLAVARERIVGEKLLVFPKGREPLLYERQHTEQGETYGFDDQLKAKNTSTPKRLPSSFSAPTTRT